MSSVINLVDLPVKKSSNVIDFYKREKIDSSTEVHYKADGTPDGRWGKRCNGVGGNASTMECLYTDGEIRNVYNVFKSKVDNANSFSKTKMSMRNLIMFLCAINIGLRADDLCRLKWDVIFDGNWNVKESTDFVPGKTVRTDKVTGVISRKHIKLRFNETFKRTLIEYLEWKRFYEKTPLLNDFIFLSQKEHFNKKTGELENCIMPKEWHKIVQNNCLEAGITRKIGTHGLRKTYGHRFYKMAVNKSEALDQLMEIFGHSDRRITLIYICITNEEIAVNQERICMFNEQETIVWDDFVKLGKAWQDYVK